MGLKMEHHQEQRLAIASEQQTKLSLTSNEILIKQCAQQRVRIGAIDARSIGVTFSDLVKKITVITGLKVDPAVGNMFAEEFTKFMMAHYSNMTLEEVGAAFYLNANESGEDKVVFYGTSLTLEAIGQVLTKYKAKRAAVVRKLNSNSALAIEAPKPTDEQMEIDSRTLVNGFYTKFLNEELTEVSMTYAHLVYDDIQKYKPSALPSADIRVRFYEEAKIHRQEELLLPNKNGTERHAARELLKQYSSEVIPVSEEEKIINEGKRRTLMFMFNEFSKQGVRSLL